MVIENSDDGNQSYTKCYLQGYVADGFPKTETSAPPNKNSVKITADNPNKLIYSLE